jgi:hypothetical protein
MFDHELSRDDALQQYRAYRAAIRRHLGGAIKHTSAATIKEAARRIGLLSDGAIACDSPREMTMAFDLAVFGTRAGRSRAIDRYARANRFPEGSTEATVLAALQAATFHIVLASRHHHVAGVVVEDLFRKQDIWLMDEGLDATMPDGTLLAARLIRLDPFHATASASVPISRSDLRNALLSLAARRATLDPASVIDDPRLPEAIFATAIKSGAMDGISFESEG